MKRILVIDDDFLTLDVLKRMLEIEGYEVVTALNGQEGIDIFHQSIIDLVITDLVMPVKDGLRTIMELRQEKPELPIIAISAGRGPSVFFNAPLPHKPSYRPEILKRPLKTGFSKSKFPNPKRSSRSKYR